MTDVLQQSILLGRGGSSPGIEAYDAISGNLEKILSLPAGHSVYAIDVSPDGIIAAGTKTGAIYWLTQQKPTNEKHGYRVQQFANGAPILAVCFVDERTLAVSDTAGRCLLWQLRRNVRPDKLPIAGGVVCSLFRLDSRYLAGLSISGQLLVWDWVVRDITNVVEVPPPPDLSSLVKLVCWSDSWVWPARGGVIVFYRWQTNDVHTIRAHTGDVYGTLVCDDELLTIGRTDGSLKRWPAGSDEPVDSLRIPHGIISAAAWSQEECRMLLLINDAGEAGVYSRTEGKVNLIKQLEGQDYRITFGPDMERLRSAMRHQKNRRVRELSVRINNKIAQRVYDDELQSLYQQLIKLGYRQVALGLQGCEAGSKNDLVAELRIYGELVDMMPPEHPGAESSLSRYAELLASVWQPHEACAIYKQLARMYPDNDGYVEGMCRASRQAGIIEHGKYVIEPDIPIPLLVKSAMILGKKFTGRYLIKNIKVPGNCNVVISTRELIEKYEHIRRTRPQESLPQAEDIELWWLSKERNEQTTTVVFASKDAESLSCLELGIKFLNAKLQTVLVPVVTFNAGRDVGNMSAEQHNNAVLEKLHHIENDSLSNAWLQMVHRNINHAIRQLITRALACRNQ